MEDYLSKLFLSPLPVSIWVLAVLWLAVHCMSLALAIRSLKFSAAEQRIVFPTEAQPKLTPQMVGLQTVLAIAVFVNMITALMPPLSHRRLASSAHPRLLSS